MLLNRQTMPQGPAVAILKSTGVPTTQRATQMAVIIQRKESCMIALVAAHLMIF